MTPKQGSKKRSKVGKRRRRSKSAKPKDSTCLHLSLSLMDPTIIFCPSLHLSFSLASPSPLIDPVINIETAVEVLRSRETRTRSAAAQKKVAFGGSSRHALLWRQSQLLHHFCAQPLHRPSSQKKQG
jgi:hypothetical protein